jgi:hypothetical protein
MKCGIQQSDFSVPSCTSARFHNASNEASTPQMLLKGRLGSRELPHGDLLTDEGIPRLTLEKQIKCRTRQDQ